MRPYDNCCAFAIAALSLLYFLLLGQLWLRHQNMPVLSPTMSANSKCLAKFMSDLQIFVSCLDRHTRQKCLPDDNQMNNREDEH